MLQGRDETGRTGRNRLRGPLAVPRPSILDHVRLSDGRLAWPVARLRGVREATFRMRLLRGMSPDEAVLRPVRSAGRRRRRA